MKKIFINIIMILCIVVSNIFSGYSEDIENNIYNLNIDHNVVSFQFEITSGQGRPIEINEQYIKGNYSYYTNNLAQITYLLHYLNSFNFIDDGKIKMGADGTYVRIKLMQKDSSIFSIGFFDNRFNDNAGKQYGVNKDEYQRFLDFVYALKTDKITLDDEVTFEPSKWAKEDVEQAIENGLVPKWNQINYIGSMTRLEVCQLVDCFLKQCGPVQIDDETQYLFEDTRDQSVMNLFQCGVVLGKSETEFYPYDFITREEFAVILERIYTLIGAETPLVEYNENYVDANLISPWAVESIKQISAIGLMQGDEKHAFCPHNVISKEEVIATLLRYHDQLLKA